MADGINPIANLLGKTDANNALLVAISGSIPAASFPLLAPDGNVGAPSYASATSPTTGLYFPASGVVAFALVGQDDFAVTNTSVKLSSTQLFGWTVGGAYANGYDLILQRPAAGNLLQANSTSAQRSDVANTYTSAVNNELFSVDWQTTANLALVGNRTAATGTSRGLIVGVQGNNAVDTFIAFKFQAAAPFFTGGLTNAAGTFAQNTTAAGNLIQLGDFTSTRTAGGSVVAVAITPTYNQASGAEANTDLLVNRTQTLVGSGAQLLLDLQVSTVSKFSVSNTGVVTAFNTIITPTSTASLQLGTSGYLGSDGTTGHAQFMNAAANAGIGLDFSTDGVLALRDRAQTGTARLTFPGANGQVFNEVQQLTELTTIAAAASTDTTIQMPANSVVLGVSVRVTVVIPTAATFTVGDSGSAARFSTAAVSTAANSTDSGVKAGAYYNASALSVRITPNATPGANSGRVRVTIYYYTITPPTS